MSSNAINSEPSNSAQDVNDNASSEPGSSSWKSKAVLAAGLGVPIGVFLAASPAAAEPDFTAAGDFSAFSGTGALGPVESVSFADLGPVQSTELASAEVDRLGPVDMFDFSLDSVETANTFQVVDSEPAVVPEPALESPRLDVDLVDSFEPNYVAIDAATGGSVMGDSELASPDGFVDVFDTVAWLDGQNDAQSVPVTESAFAQSPESPAAVASAELSAEPAAKRDLFQALREGPNNKPFVLAGRELETVEAGVPLLWFGATAAAAAIFGTAATMEAVDNTDPITVPRSSSAEPEGRSALDGLSAVELVQSVGVMLSVLSSPNTRDSAAGNSPDATRGSIDDGAAGSTLSFPAVESAGSASSTGDASGPLDTEATLTTPAAEGQSSTGLPETQYTEPRMFPLPGFTISNPFSGIMASKSDEPASATSDEAISSQTTDEEADEPTRTAAEEADEPTRTAEQQLARALTSDIASMVAPTSENLSRAARAMRDYRVAQQQPSEFGGPDESQTPTADSLELPYLQAGYVAEHLSGQLPDRLAAADSELELELQELGAAKLSETKENLALIEGQRRAAIASAAKSKQEAIEESRMAWYLAGEAGKAYHDAGGNKSYWELEGYTPLADAWPAEEVETARPASTNRSEPNPAAQRDFELAVSLDLFPSAVNVSRLPFNPSEMTAEELAQLNDISVAITESIASAVQGTEEFERAEAWGETVFGAAWQPLNQPLVNWNTDRDAASMLTPQSRNSLQGLGIEASVVEALPTGSQLDFLRGSSAIRTEELQNPSGSEAHADAVAELLPKLTPPEVAGLDLDAMTTTGVRTTSLLIDVSRQAIEGPRTFSIGEPDAVAVELERMGLNPSLVQGVTPQEVTFLSTQQRKSDNGVPGSFPLRDNVPDGLADLNDSLPEGASEGPVDLGDVIAVDGHTFHLDEESVTPADLRGMGILSKMAADRDRLPPALPEETTTAEGDYVVETVEETPGLFSRLWTSLRGVRSLN